MTVQLFKNTIGFVFVSTLLSNSQIATANQLQTICNVIPNDSMGSVGINVVQDCTLNSGEVFAGVSVLYTGTATASAAYGTLKASSSVTTNNLTNIAVSGQSSVTVNEVPNGSSIMNDTITITSSTLPNGSPVSLQAFISLHAVFSDSGGLGQNTFGSLGGTSGAAINFLTTTYNDTGISGFSVLGLTSREWEYSGQGTQSFQSYGAAAFSTNEMRFGADLIGMTINIPTHVGQQITFNNQLSALSYAILGTEPISLNSFTNANNTSLFYLSSSSADVSWLSESGASYLAPLTAVPEPEAYAMFLAGLGIMGFVVRRRKNNNT